MLISRKPLPYDYSHLPIPGGGYVTGFRFHRKVPGILYARTDIGGTYRYDPESAKWKSLIERAGMDDLSETFPLAIALDDRDPDLLYVACGDGRGWWGSKDSEHLAERPCGILAISNDRGESFQRKNIPCYIHGNLPGRGTGDRLIVSPADAGTLYFASQRDGLLITRDGGESWDKRSVCGEKYLTLVWMSDDASVLIAGTAGISLMKEDMRGHSLYISRDGGETFEKLPSPENHPIPKSLLSGYVAQRICSDKHHVYVTLSNTGARNYLREMGYSCDTGDQLGGRIIRYAVSDLKDLPFDEIPYEDITPEYTNEDLTYGFGGISVCQSRPGLLAAATLCRDEGDLLYISHDFGAHWERALDGLKKGNLHFHTSYMKPCYNGGGSLLHWHSDVKIDPFDPDRVWINTGTGVFTGKDFTSADRSFSDACGGIEETVHLNLYSPPSGDVRVIDILGDLGGFAFTDTDKECENSFADDQGNRYITCLNADYPDNDPSMIAVTARGNWTGKTIGGLIVSLDGAGHFRRLPLPYGLTKRMDELCAGIEHPNVNVGWTAVGADGHTLILSLADGNDLPADCVVVWHAADAPFPDASKKDAPPGPAARGEVSPWKKVRVTGLPDAKEPERLKVFADRVVPGVFYGFGEHGRFFVSTDYGESFQEKEIPGFPDLEFGKVDCANRTEIRGDSGFAGKFYIAAAEQGLWKLEYDQYSDTARAGRITDGQTQVFRVGLGLLHGEASYIGCPKALYICGVMEGIHGFFRSDDDGATWHRLNDDDHRFGEINSIEGDSREAGSFYIGTGTLGLWKGKAPASEESRAEHRKKVIAVFGGALYEEHEFGFLKALTDACGEDYIVCVYSFSVDDVKEERLSNRETELIELAKEMDYVGIVLMVVSMLSNTKFCDAIVEIGRKQRVPVFAFEQSYPGCINLPFAYKESFKEMVEHVIREHGCRRIDLIAGVKGNTYSDEREEAYREVLAGHGIPVEEKRIKHGEFWDRPARTAMEEFLDEDGLPDAVVCANDTMAVAACEVLNERGFRVPEDVIVTGFDDIQAGLVHNPSITSVGTDFAEGARFVIDRIREGRPTDPDGEEHPLQGIQKRRRSCGCLMEDQILSRGVVSEFADSFMDVNWSMRLMNQMTSRAAILDDLEMLAREAQATLWVWKKQFHFVGLYSELLEDHLGGGASGRRFHTFLKYHDDVNTEIMGGEFPVTEVMPCLDEVLSKEQPYRLLMFRLLSTTDTSYGYLAQGMTGITNRDVRRCDEIGMFLSTALNTVLNNRRLGMLNRHLREANAEIEKRAVSDYLTGIYNRRGFFSRLSEELANPANDGKVLTIFSIDMDGLKHINDHYGHNEGDLAICGMAEAIRHFSARNGFCARYGGDEFACALITEKEVALPADLVRKRLDEAIKRNSSLSNKPYPVVASVGSVHAMIHRKLDVEEMIRKADNAMYRDKVKRRQ
ncbi:MAG: diguanylate cyclase [Lachnospiraceae bacterium]|nr:diguanylate cyclase [Lachnospiraceae bacterium]